jgi:large subunit ribosomal protein L22
MKTNIKYSPKKMWYIACFVRGMSIDEAVKQLSFLHRKGAEIAKEVILEAQRMAVENHHVEFKSNLWVGKYINIYIYYALFILQIF